MKIKIGDYIRTAWGIVGKVLNIITVDTDDGSREAVEIDNLAPVVFVSEIEKCDENIVKLIKENDVLRLYDSYYNDDYKAEVFLNSNEELCVSDFDRSQAMNLQEAINDGTIIIRKIVTDECFKSVEYEVNK